MPFHMVHCPGTLGLDPNVLSHIGMDTNNLTTIIPIENAMTLVLTSWATIMVEPLFLSHVI